MTRRVVAGTFSSLWPAHATPYLTLHTKQGLIGRLWNREVPAYNQESLFLRAIGLSGSVSTIMGLIGGNVTDGAYLTDQRSFMIDYGTLNPAVQ